MVRQLQSKSLTKEDLNQFLTTTSAGSKISSTDLHNIYEIARGNAPSFQVRDSRRGDSSARINNLTKQHPVITTSSAKILPVAVRFNNLDEPKKSAKEVYELVAKSIPNRCEIEEVQ
jgi:hypothetical protein